MSERERFETWVQSTRVWKKYQNTRQACSLRQTVKGDYCDYRINDRWIAWNASLTFAKEQTE